MARPTGTYDDLTGRTFGRTRVLGRAGNRGPRMAALWSVICDPALGGCGTARVVTGHALKQGRCRRCQSCKGRALAARQAAAGHSGPGGRLYQPIWPRVCRACGAEFRGTARQVYCSPPCRPSYRGCRP